ncbi:NYN domain-containing protein [Candidatus Accumulibacter sp. ACC003]|uniref:NYN domain-containing protein n=1 Tax=Candidatus Accumulibacter sp. ACC003 TaxID=2823334 RepID=UPI0025BD12E3|nr:NYN domain-containing protein [Candidatus Accumulibacter sp. ACC003]
MAVAPETASMALFCDFENVALGVRDAKYDKFDIKPVLEKLLLKGSIVVKKAYCDWERYKGFKAAMHEANFELIEIPHLRQSGKNSADIRLVVDALDLCYTKSHVDTFVIISGDSDFSPLVSKLRENAKSVIGVGVKQSTSDLLIANCDEFIFYDDLVREMQRSARRDSKEVQAVVRRSPEEDAQRKEELEARRSKAVELAVATFDALIGERGDSSKIWASMLKEAIKRRKPDFNESYYGFRAFGNLLEEAQSRGLLEIGRDEKSGSYVYRRNGLGGLAEPSAPAFAAPAVAGEAPIDSAVTEELADSVGGGRKGQGRRKAGEKGGKRSREPKASKEEGVDLKEGVVKEERVDATNADGGALGQPELGQPEPWRDEVPALESPALPEARKSAATSRPTRRARPTRADKVPPGEEAPAAPATVAERGDSGSDSQPAVVAVVAGEAVASEAAEPVKKAATRSRRPRKPKVAPEAG